MELSQDSFVSNSSTYKIRLVLNYLKLIYMKPD